MLTLRYPLKDVDNQEEFEIILSRFGYSHKLNIFFCDPLEIKAKYVYLIVDQKIFYIENYIPAWTPDLTRHYLPNEDELKEDEVLVILSN